MDKVYEISLSLEELKILQLALTENWGLRYSLSFYAKEEGKDVKEVLSMSEKLYHRVSYIIDKNTI